MEYKRQLLSKLRLRVFFGRKSGLENERSRALGVKLSGESKRRKKDKSCFHNDQEKGESRM